MGLPVNIDDLINSTTVESSRKEFKKGWNPEDVIHTITAFANDINELGGGYIFVGIEEKDGSPILPPHGLPQEQVDSIQRKFIELCHKISPKIFPVIEVVVIQEKFVVIIWVTTGEERPYDCPVSLGTKAQRAIYVRPASLTMVAGQELERRLRNLAVYKHFDDRVNTSASLQDLDLGLMLSHLQETKAQLYAEASALPFEDLCLKMGIARGPKENIKPLNVGLLLFSNDPKKFFEGCYTHLIEFEDVEGIQYSEKKFYGPVHSQIRQILEYLNSHIIKEYTIKNPIEVDSDRFVNYPHGALKELIVNSMYHRGYEQSAPNEIRIYKKGNDRRIEILSYPGPLPPIDEQSLVQLQLGPARNYRNIKLGDWLKQLRLAEKFATGIPTVVRELEKNGSLRPILSTDESKSHFTAVVKIHPDTPVDDLASDSQGRTYRLSDLQQKILEELVEEPLGLGEIVNVLGNHVSTELHFLVEQGFLGMKTIMSTRLMVFEVKSELYYITPKGREALRSAF